MSVFGGYIGYFAKAVAWRPRLLDRTSVLRSGCCAKTNMEPENEALEEEIFLLKTIIFRFHVSFRECNQNSNDSKSNPPPQKKRHEFEFYGIGDDYLLPLWKSVLAFRGTSVLNDQRWRTWWRRPNLAAAGRGAGLRCGVSICVSFGSDTPRQD